MSGIRTPKRQSVETIAVPKEILQGIFDLAVNSLDFGSDFWGDDDVRFGRAVAELLGVDAIVGTPIKYAQRIHHEFKQIGTSLACRHCYLGADAPVHTGEPA